jgi:3-oxoacyl-[acyl-carrier protein] reductase
MDLGLNGRTVIVTGASGGIGRHIARRFAGEGADVVLTYHSEQSDAERVAKEIGTRSLVVRYALDDADSAQALVAAALDWTGRVDVLVNNAVGWGAAAQVGSFEETPDASWLATLRLNVEGAIRLTRLVAPPMRERRWGRLVHMSSTLAVDGATGAAYYGAAKAALHGFNRSVAFELGSHDILSNVVMPGLIVTERNTAIVEQVGEHYAGRAALGRLLDAAEVATPIVYLGSAANTGITGQVVTVNGGA